MSKRKRKPAAADPPALPADPADFRNRLTAWFRETGRDYPWRRTTDPYAILVSEVMLQQTRIATVLERGYYDRWMRAFPDVATLAAAPVESVLLAWEGLGYYSRARNLQRAALAVVGTHGGTFPRDVGGIRALPGVGRYTAAAVASFAWNAPEPLVDGNVARILARLTACDDPVDSPAVQRQLWEWAGALTCPRRARLYNSGIMELGQRICTPRRPDCGECPVRPHCRSAGPAADARPRKSPRRATVEVEEHAVFARKRGRILLHLESGRRRRGLWKLPVRPADELVAEPVVLRTVYTITHHRVALSVHRPRSVRAEAGDAWHAVGDLPSLPMPGPFRRVVDRLIAEGTG